MTDSIIYITDTIYQTDTISLSREVNLQTISEQLKFIQNEVANHDSLIIGLITTSAVLLAALIPVLMEHRRNQSLLKREQAQRQINVVINMKAAVIQLESAWMKLANFSTQHNLLNRLNSLGLRSDNKDTLASSVNDRAPELQNQLTIANQNINIAKGEYGCYFPHDNDFADILKNAGDISFTISVLYTDEDECIEIGDKWNSDFINDVLMEIKKDNRSLYNKRVGDFYLKVLKQMGSQCDRTPIIED